MWVVFGVEWRFAWLVGGLLCGCFVDAKRNLCGGANMVDTMQVLVRSAPRLYRELEEEARSH